jgi:hypothetical protein
MILVSLAVAAPAFLADHPADAVIAERAWRAAEACTGWSGRAHDTVRLTRGDVRLGFRGLASADDGGMYAIEIDAADPQPNEVIVHEVAHAWIAAGPTALVEGRAELLADCIVHRAPGIAPLQWDDGRELHALPALQDWNAGDGLGPSVNPLQRTDAYVGAARLVRLAGLVLPEGALWPEDDVLGWSELDALLAEAGEPALPIRALLGATGAEQAAALTDRDGDGLPELGERIFGTDPTSFDTDGDGWWDGASVREGRRPVPVDGTPVCTGWATPPTGGVVTLQTGGNLRGSPPPVPVLVAGDKQSTEGSLTVWGAHSVVVRMNGGDGQLSGGLWAHVDPTGLVPDPHCIQRDRVVAWADRPQLRERVPQIVQALEGALARLDERLGGGVARVAVVLGGSTTSVEGAVVRIATDEALHTPVDALAAQVVAMRRVWDRSPSRDWRDVVALQRSLLAR